jgi:hypothetical protein
MADRTTTGPPAGIARQVRGPYDSAHDPPLPNADDPGGAHRKGYSADARPGKPAPEKDPVPLAADAEVHGHVRKPETDPALPPTGRSESPSPTSRERVLGADIS